MSEWLEGLPEELRDAPFLGKATDAKDALGKLTHAAQVVGTSIRIPSDDATDEQRTAFYDKLKEVNGVAVLPDPDDAEGVTGIMRKLGAPEEADKYELPELEDFEWDEGIAADLRQYAAEAGLTKAQFKRFASKIAEQEQSAANENSEAKTAAQKALEKEWGAAKDDREALIRGWMKQSEAPESLQGLLEEGNLPVEAMNWLYNTAKAFEGDVSPISKDSAPSRGSLTPDEANEKMAEIRSGDAYWDNTHPLHRETVKKMQRLQQLALGEQAA